MPTVLPSVEKGLLGRGRWDKPLPARGPQESWLTEARTMKLVASAIQEKLNKRRVRKLSAEARVV